MNAILRSLAIVVGIPTFLATVYFGLIASDVYVSEARFAIRSAKLSGGDSGLLAALASPLGGSGGQETLIMSNYVQSQDMLRKVQKRLDVKQHYASDKIDWVARLDSEASDEDVLEYFKEQIELVRDSQSDVVTLKVRAFERGLSKDLAELVIELGEKLVNEMSTRMEEDALATARAELDLAIGKVRKASGDITSFRNVNASLDPTRESSALFGITSGIETSLIEARAELQEKNAYMRETSPAIVSLKNRINALQRQLGLERGRLVGGEEGQEMSELIEGYQPLVLEQEIAQQQYASALTSLELARIEAQRKKQYLITFIEPNLPDEALEPRRLAEILTVMIFSFLAYLIGGLLWSALKDHIGR